MKCFLVAFFAVAAAVWAGDRELPLVNGEFEEGLKGWTVSTGAPEGAVRVGPEGASIGRNGLVVRTGADLRVTSSALPVRAGESYAVDFWSAGGVEAGGKAAVQMVFQDASGAILKPAMAKIRKWPGGGTATGRFWEKTTLAAAAPEGATTLVLQISAKSGDGLARLDDFRVVELGEIAPVRRGPDGAAEIPPFDPARIAFLEKEIAADPLRGGQAPPKIVLKLDDLGPRGGAVHPKWVQVADLARDRKIPVTFGIVAQGMEEDAPAFFQWVKERHASGEIEFWNHGYDHAEWKDASGGKVQEFKGSGLEHQLKHMADANRLAREKLGFPFVSFGAPFNATDADTVKALEAAPDIKVWMYGQPGNPAGKVVLERCSAVSIESPTFVPNYADFLEGYAHNRGAAYFVLQGHPTHWNQERWDQFVKIVDFLIARQAVFVKASDFAAR